MGLLAVVLVLALVGCDSDADRIRATNEAFNTPPAASTAISAEIQSTDIQVGDCINSTLPEGISIETVVIVPCSGTWQYRALNSFDIADSARYPGEDFFSQQADERCDRHYSILLFPLTESWDLGYRTVSCLQDSFGLSISDPAKLDRLVSLHSLSSGECFRQAPETEDLQVELVSCSGDWERRVLDTFIVPDSDRYPGIEFFNRLAYEKCDRRYTHTLSPTLDSWKIGERRLVCLQDGFGLPVTDPAKLDRLVNRHSLNSGECFKKAPETQDLQVELANCSDDWEFQVTNRFPVPHDDGYPDIDYFNFEAEQKCDAPSDIYFFPTVESWSLDGRTVTCVRSFESTIASP